MEYIPWEGADALEIIPISILIDEMKQLEAYEDEEPFGLPVAAGYLTRLKPI